MAERQLTTREIITLLREGPGHIAKATAGLASTKLQTPPGPGEWSANDVLAHLRACADMWGQCIEVMLTEDKPTIRAVNPRTWIEKTNYLELKFNTSLRAFATQRAALVARLEPLSHKDWQRSATITGAGKPIQRTVLSYAQWMATHERPHLKQIQRAANLLRT